MHAPAPQDPAALTRTLARISLSAIPASLLGALALFALIPAHLLWIPFVIAGTGSAFGLAGGIAMRSLAKKQVEQAKASARTRHTPQPQGTTKGSQAHTPARATTLVQHVLLGFAVVILALAMIALIGKEASDLSLEDSLRRTYAPAITAAAQGRVAPTPISTADLNIAHLIPGTVGRVPLDAKADLLCVPKRVPMLLVRKDAQQQYLLSAERVDGSRQLCTSAPTAGMMPVQ